MNGIGRLRKSIGYGLRFLTVSSAPVLCAMALADHVGAAALPDSVDGDLRETFTAVYLGKLASVLGELATHITNNVGHVVNYGERFRAGERISAGFVESAIKQIVDKRCGKRQSTRWTPRGAHLLLQTRTRVLNGDRDQLIRRRYPAFSRPQPTGLAPVL
jgi:hypothetical protein